MVNVLIFELGGGYMVCTFLYVCDTSIKKPILTTHTQMDTRDRVRRKCLQLGCGDGGTVYSTRHHCVVPLQRVHLVVYKFYLSKAVKIYINKKYWFTKM